MFCLSEYIPDKNNKLDMLYCRYARSLWLLALSYVQDEYLAEDVVQDTFIRLACCPGCIGRVDAKQTKCFVYTITKHLCVDFLRMKKRRGECCYETYADTGMESSDYMPLEYLMIRETADEVCELLKKLPENYRTALELRLIREMSNREIARILRITPNLAAVRIFRGKGMIQKLFWKENE